MIFASSLSLLTQMNLRVFSPLLCELQHPASLSPLSPSSLLLFFDPGSVELDFDKRVRLNHCPTWIRTSDDVERGEGGLAHTQQRMCHEK